MKKYKNRNTWNAYKLLSLSALVGMGSLSLLAEEPEAEQNENSSETLDELIVTGDLWQSPLKKLPASVTVIAPESLQLNGVQNFGDLVHRIPNLSGAGATSRTRFFQIRGLGENSQYEGETPDSSVRFIIDDMDFTGLGGAASTFDVSQVEVLRGPQAGAFGANAAGGLIRLLSNTPTPYWSGVAEASFGTDNLRRGGVALGGPILQRDPEELMFRFSLEHNESDGFHRNAYLNRYTNERDEWFSRFRVQWKPQPDWEFDGTFFYANQDNGFDVFALDNNGRFTFSDEPGRDEQESMGGSLRSTYHGWDGVKVSSISSFAYVDSFYSYDDDWVNPGHPAFSYQGLSEIQRIRKIWNQEFRLDSTEDAERFGIIDRWTLGGFFSLLDEDSGFFNTSPSRVKFLRTDYRNRNLALFGQAQSNLNEKNRLTFGLRMEQVNVRGTGVSGRDGVADVLPSYAKKNDTLFGGKLSFEHDLTDSVIGFASVTMGYKAGGINNDSRINVAAGDPLTFDTEKLWNYELGIRGTGFDDRLQGSLVAFYTDRRNFQMTDSAGLGGDYRYFTANGGRGSLLGLEADARYDLGGDWSLYGSLGLLRSDSDATVFANGTPWRGGRLANAPKYNYSLGIRYQPESGLFGSFDLLGSASYLESSSHSQQRRAFSVANASIGYRYENWTATLWARNLFDKVYDDRVFYFANEAPWIDKRYTAQAPPRQIGVTMRYEF